MNTVYHECLKLLNAQTGAEGFAGITGCNIGNDWSVWTDHTKFTGTVFADNGYIEGKELDDFFRHMMKRLGPKVSQYTCDAWISWWQQLSVVHVNGRPAAVCMGGGAAHTSDAIMMKILHPHRATISAFWCLKVIRLPWILMEMQSKQTITLVSLPCLLISIIAPRTSTGLCTSV